MATHIDNAGIERLFHDPEGPIAKIMTQKAFLVQGEVRRKLLQDPHTGAIYEPGVTYFRRGGKTYRFERAVAHQASAPGESPASDTGVLAGGTGILMEDGPDGIRGYIFYTAEYGEYLELGTRYMAPRPNLRPTVDRVNEL